VEAKAWSTVARDTFFPFDSRSSVAYFVRHESADLLPTYGATCFQFFWYLSAADTNLCISSLDQPKEAVTEEVVVDEVVAVGPCNFNIFENFVRHESAERTPTICATCFQSF
jgi:hypothetical protein